MGPELYQLLDWREGVERTYHTVRRASFLIGAVAGASLAVAVHWPEGWVMAAILALTFARATVAGRHPTSITTEVLLDAAAIGIAAWAVGVRGTPFMLLYPLAIAVLLGDRRLIVRVAGIASAIMVAVNLDDVFPGVAAAVAVSRAFDPPAWTEAQQAAIGFVAIYSVGGLLLFFLSLMSRTLRRAEAAQATLLSNAAPDMQNAVAAIEGLVLLASDPQTTDFDELLAALRETTAETSGLSGDLLSLARYRSSGDPREAPFDLADLAKNIAMGIAGTEVRIDVPLTVQSDDRRAGQVIRNLLTNAHRHGGARVVVSAHRRDDMAIVEVADDGDGIDLPPDRVFEPRTPSSTGLGIGLSVSRGLARRLGGDVKHRRADGWTNIAFELPIAR